MNADKLLRQTARKNDTFEGSISEIKTKDIALVVPYRDLPCSDSRSKERIKQSSLECD